MRNGQTNLLSESNSAVANLDQHKKLLQSIAEEKKQRKKREDERRQKTMDRYVKDTEEKQKLEGEMKARLAEEKLQRHMEKLDKIKREGELRKAKI